MYELWLKTTVSMLLGIFMRELNKLNELKATEQELIQRHAQLQHEVVSKKKEIKTFEGCSQEKTTTQTNKNTKEAKNKK